MKSEDMFAGFTVGAGEDRFAQPIKIGGEPNDCKVSGRDTAGAMCVFEFTGTGSGPRHAHREQDEWIYVLEGELDFVVGERPFRAKAGETIFLPRNVPHVWAAVGDRDIRIIDTYQPAGSIEQFFREVGKYSTPPIHEVLSVDELCRLFDQHGMDLLPPLIIGEDWKVDANGRIVAPPSYRPRS